MPATGVGVDDKAAGAGVLELLTLDVPTGFPASLTDLDVQPFQALPVGNLFDWKVAGSLTPVLVSDTQGYVTVAAQRVDAGEVFLLDRLSILQGVAAPVHLRAVRRWLVYHHNVNAAPAAGAAPTVAAAAHDVGMDADALTRSYKFTYRDASGRENVASAASAAVATTAGNRSVSITLPALPAGAFGYNIYRSLGGAAAAGPWYWVDEEITGPYVDVRRDADLKQSRTAPGAATWDTLAHVSSAASPGELVAEVAGALTASPGFAVVVNNNGRQERVPVAIPLTLGTRYRIKNRQEARALAAYSVAASMVADQNTSEFSARGLNGFNTTVAAVGGQLLIWNEQTLATTEFNAVPAAGAVNKYRLSEPALITPGWELALQIGQTGGTVGAGFREIKAAGRIISVPAT